MGKLVRLVLLPLLVLLALFFALVLALASGVGGGLEARGPVTAAPIPGEAVTARASRQAAARVALSESRALSEPSALSEQPSAQILFGDLHVHTTFSLDAFFFSLPMIQGEGAHPPADACDFARYCAELDFWSINDHAELITPRQWQETRDAVRECNAVAGDAAAPDLVSFLGWEWTQMAPNGETEHYGHKNVILRDTADDAVPARPIGSAQTPMGRLGALGVGALVAYGSLSDAPAIGPTMDFNRWLREVGGYSLCPDDVPVRDLPSDCLEQAPAPDGLFRKLDDWGFESLVIPHGTSWGIHAPAGASLDVQLATGMHDPARQRLFEVYSGHGASEVYRDFVAALPGEGAARCPEPSADYEPCCWRAGELVRERCGDAPAEVCEARVLSARSAFLDAGFQRYGVVPGSTPEEWLGCGQLTAAADFLPAYEYRPRMSAQYGLARRRPEAGAAGAMRFGLIGSSDNHKARAGSGYKELGRKSMGDAWGPRQDLLDALAPETTRAPEPLAAAAVPQVIGLMPERGASFYYTGGLVAVHSDGRGRDAIWDALSRREVYGTSGERILLWFDVLNAAAGPAPMGSEVRVDGTPRFSVRAAGAFVQKPGCPAHTLERLSPERVENLCLGECYHPSDERRAITRIEVVRIRPQQTGDEPIAPLVEDPWRTLFCAPDPTGCTVTFEDPDFRAAGREHVYYVRAIQEPTPAVNGDPLRCERDAQGRCAKTRPCYASGPEFDAEDECLAAVEERAWSSPIFVDPLR